MFASVHISATVAVISSNQTMYHAPNMAFLIFKEHNKQPQEERQHPNFPDPNRIVL